jgi:hypothetical protein
LDLVVHEDHVALGLQELGSVPLIAPGRDAILLLSNKPFQLVLIHPAAKLAVQAGGLLHLTLYVK